MITAAMIKLNISDAQRNEIAEAIDDPTTSERAKIKLLAIRLHDLGTPHGHIAAALNITDDTVTSYLKAFRKGGVGELIENRQFRPTSSVEPFLEDITRSLTERPAATAKEAAHRIKIGPVRKTDVFSGRSKIAIFACRRTTTYRRNCDAVFFEIAIFNELHENRRFLACPSCGVLVQSAINRSGRLGLMLTGPWHSCSHPQVVS